LLTLDRVRTPTDAGMYMCYSINTIGAAQDRIEVTEQELAVGGEIDLVKGGGGEELGVVDQVVFDDFEMKWEMQKEEIEKFKEAMQQRMTELRNETFQSGKHFLSVRNTDLQISSGGSVL
jgi:hypothetical protein